MNDNGNTVYWNLWDTKNTVLRGKFIVTLNKNEERSQINKLSLHLKELKE